MSNKVDRALGTKPYSNSRTPTTKLVQENTIKVLNKHRKGIRLSTALIWAGVLVAMVVLWKTAPQNTFDVCNKAGVISNLCKG